MTSARPSAHEYSATFVVRNKGNADLIIEDAAPGCGCTAAKFDASSCRARREDRP
jgi:hypothetical protein